MMKAFFSERDIAEVLGALELGIIPPCEDISKCLETLNREEQRLVKRKFRKLKRKHLLFHPELSHRHVRTLVREECVTKGMRLLAG